MITPFHKMHGAGNDFVILDARGSELRLTQSLIAALCHRQTGIGCDQLVTIEPDAASDALIRFYNQDGTESGTCGNASRCAADFLYRQTGRTHAVLRTAAGLLATQRLNDGRFQIDMGAPLLKPDQIPLARNLDTLHLPLPGDPAACSMGNPHATWFVPDLDREDIARLGPARESDLLFPDRANIGFAQILAPDRIRLKVWERGAGLTLACGSGACATLVNAHRRGLAHRRAELILDGGTLTIEWAADNHVQMTGPSALVYQGQIDLANFLE